MDINEFRLINVFTGEQALGNQCCVLRLEDLSNTSLLQQIAADFNLPATAFIQKVTANNYKIRWFAPLTEIELCGHGALAATHALKPTLNLSEVKLAYSGGEIIGKINTNTVSLKTSGFESEEVPVPDAVQQGFNEKVKNYYVSEGKHLVLLNDEESVAQMQPNWDALRAIDTFAYAVTAPSKEVDFVSRTFLPFIPELEDHATGSSHLVLAPFWANRLSKTELIARQLSKRGGEMICKIDNDLVEIEAQCVVFGKGNLL